MWIAGPFGGAPTEALFVEVSRQHDAASFMVNAGTLIDASLAEAAARRPADGPSAQRQGSRLPRDPDANRTRAREGRQPSFGEFVRPGAQHSSGP